MPVQTKQQTESITRAMPALTALAALVYAAAGYFLLLSPALSKVVSGGSLDVAPLRSEVADLESYSSDLGKATEGYVKLNADHKDRVGRMIASEPGIHDLIVQMDALATKHQLALVSMDAAVDEKGNHVASAKTIRATANVAGGGYPEFKAFLADVESTMRITDVQSVVFSAGTGSYSLVFRAYFVPETK